MLTCYTSGGPKTPANELIMRHAGEACKWVTQAQQTLGAARATTAGITAAGPQIEGRAEECRLISEYAAVKDLLFAHIAVIFLLKEAARKTPSEDLEAAIKIAQAAIDDTKREFAEITQAAETFEG